MKRTLPLPASRSLYVLLIALLFTMAACDAGAPTSEQAPDETATKAPAPGSLVIEVEPTFADSTTDSTGAARPGTPLRHRRAILQQAAREHPSLKPHIEIEATHTRTNGTASRASGVSSRATHSRPPARSMNAEETEGLKERGQVVLAQTSYEGAEANLTGTIVQNGNAVAAGSLSTSVPPEGTLLYTGDVDRGDTMELELAGSYEGDPVVAGTVPLSSWVLGYSFGEWATGVTTTLYRVLPDGSTEQIAQTTFAFYHIPDVEELEVTTAPLTKLYAGDTTAVHVAGIGSDGEPARLPDATALDVSADDGGTGVGALYERGSDAPFTSFTGITYGALKGDTLIYVADETEEEPPPPLPSRRQGVQPPQPADAEEEETITDVALDASLTAKPNISGAATLPVSDWTREEALAAHLKSNPYALLDVPCSQIPKYVELAQFTPPESVVSRVQAQNVTYTSPITGYTVTTSGYIQALEDATGLRVSMDRYGVRVPESNLPSGMTAEEYYEHWRTNFNSYFDEDAAQFLFYPGLPNEEERWTNNPLGTLFSIQLMAADVSWLEDGSVVTSKYSASDWIFSTVFTPSDLRHPVSGNRQFGFERDGSDVIFYTRGIDRLSFIDHSLLNFTTRLFKKGGLIFGSAHDVWTNMQQHLKSDLGSSAQVLTPETIKPDYDKLQEVIKRKADVTILGCSE